MSVLKTRPATEADFKALGERPNVTTRARAIIVDGGLVGLAGYYLREGNVRIFATFTDEARAKRGFWVGVTRFLRPALKEAEELGMPVVALADPDIPRSARFLEHLGFKHERGDIYRYG